MRRGRSCLWALGAGELTCTAEWRQHTYSLCGYPPGVRFVEWTDRRQRCGRSGRPLRCATRRAVAARRRCRCRTARPPLPAWPHRSHPFVIAGVAQSLQRGRCRWTRSVCKQLQHGRGPAALPRRAAPEPHAVVQLERAGRAARLGRRTPARGRTFTPTSTMTSARHFAPRRCALAAPRSAFNGGSSFRLVGRVPPHCAYMPFHMTNPHSMAAAISSPQFRPDSSSSPPLNALSLFIVAASLTWPSALMPPLSSA